MLSVSAQPFAVGHLSRSFTDSTRNRTISCEIYYPAAAAGNNVPVAAGVFPVVVFGHGFLMTWSAYDVVWNSLVPAGYIVAFPTTETSAAPSHLNFGKDMAWLVKALKAEGLDTQSTFYGAVATTSVVMGHSMGGGSAFLAAAYDTSITALASFAAANTNPSAITVAGTITIPSLTISGANDCIAPAAQHQQPMYDSLASSCKTFVSITGASHCQFASSNFFCSIGEATCSPSATISAATQQATANTLLLHWLDFYLKKNCQAGADFQQYLSSNAGITAAQNCQLTCTGIAVHTPQPYSIRLSPNPVSTGATLECSVELKDAALIFRDQLGRTCFTLQHLSGNRIPLLGSVLTPGYYSIQILNSDQAVYSAKLLVTE